MTGSGRPLRFLGLVMTGWVGARAVMLWPVDAALATGRAVVPQAPATATSRPDRPLSFPLVLRWRYSERTWVGGHHPSSLPDARRWPAMPVKSVPPIPPAQVFEPMTAVPTGIIAGLPIALSPPRDERRSRFFGSAWLVARGGGGPAGGVPRVQLGGSQAGVRLGYALTGDRRLALIARASAPLSKGMRELALGVEWQPTRLPVRIVAEQRFALGEGRGGPTLAAVGGVGPIALAAGFRLEAYVQGGVIGRDGAEGFADGAVRVARPVATSGDVRLDLGAGSWGAVQRGARRIDVGPSLSATLPIARQPVRLSVDWRLRVAGNAAPGSGLVVTVGADF